MQGKRYWVAVLGLNGRIQFRDSNSSWCHSETSRQTTLTSLPARWWTGSRYSSCLVSMFGSGGISSSVSVSVSVSPQTAALQPAQQTQFTAAVSGTTNTAVTWKTSGGTVTSSGLYTAPSLNGTYTVEPPVQRIQPNRLPRISRLRNPLRCRFPFLRARRIFKPEGSNNSPLPCLGRATQAWRGKPPVERSRRLACTLLPPRQALTP
jgi:hypothetical protein